jgi:hypothetical protein
MARQRVLEWDKEGDGIRQIRGSDELPSGVTLTNPTAEVQMRTGSSLPEVWDTDATVVVDDVSVVDAVADDGTTVLAADQAVQFTLTKDTAALPDETDTPVPGSNYRVVVTADRSDAGDWVGKVPLVIHP